MNAFSIDPDEQIDDLFLKNYKIIQKQGCFRYGTDAVVLSDFAEKYIKKGSRLLDVGTGTGILPLLLSAKTEAAELVGLEIQEEMVRLAERSVHLNEQSGALKQGRVRIVEGDIRNAKEYFPPRSFDVVVTNPPYKRNGTGIRSGSERLDLARHEISCTLPQIVQSASFLLKSRGDFLMVHHPERLADALEALRACRLEPKELQLVYSDLQARPILFLVHAVLFGGKNLVIEKGIEVK